MKMKIAYLVHNLNDPAVARRCRMFERGGAEVLLAGFCRDKGLASEMVVRGPLVLGTSADADMFQRAIATLRNAAFNRRLTHFFENCQVLVVRNLEQLAVGASMGIQRPLVYECLDIHHLLVGQGLAARAIQAVEARLLPRVDLLITSSPGFIDNHFAGSSLKAPWLLVENKLLIDDADSFEPIKQAPLSEPIRIGWFGMLRCARTLETLKEISRSSNGRVEILIAGRPSPAVFTDFAAALAGTRGIEFAGSYSYGDLPDLYGRCHFAWTIDWYEEGENSSWLLPNRIYEAVAHGSIPIALESIQVGRWLAARNAGLLVSDPAEVGAAIKQLSSLDIAQYQKAVSAVPKRDVLADDEDCKALVQALSHVKCQ